jgi:hypothetical protein
VTYAIIPLAVAFACIWLGRRLLTVILILAYLSVEGLLKLLSNYNSIVHVGIDVIVLSVTGLMALDAVVRHHKGLPDLPWVRLIALYAVWVALEVLNPYSIGLVPSLGAFKTHLTMIPLYFLGAALVKNRDDLARILVALVLISFVPYIASIAQYALGPSSVVDLSPRYWQNIRGFHEWRPFGTSAVPGGSAVYAFLLAPLALVLLMAPKIRQGTRLLAGMSILLAAGTFVVSGVRQLFLGCLLALVVMAALVVSRGRSRGVGGLIFVAVLGVAAYVGIQTYLAPLAAEAIKANPLAPAIWRERSVTDRLATLTQSGTFLAARANPLPGIWQRAVEYPFGAGLGRTGSAAGAFQKQILADPASARLNAEVGWSDNFFADMIVETGLPGMLMLTTILLGMLVGAARLARTAGDPLMVAVAAATAGLFAGLLLMSWGSQPLMSNPLTAYFWFLSGVVASMGRLENASHATEEEEPAEDIPEPVLQNPLRTRTA